MRSVQFGLCSVRIFSFFLSFFLAFLLFLSVFSVTDTEDSRGNREGRRNHYFSCFPLPPPHQHWFSSPRFLPPLFNRPNCNYQTESWWLLFSLKLFISFAFSLIQLRRSYWLWHFKVTMWGFEHISRYHPSITKWAT